jgi:hypothetical protein
MFRVDRPSLLSEIWDLTQTHSVLITGSPGIGKSWTIAQFIRKCRINSRPHLAVAAEDFEVRSVDELTSALGFKTDVLPFLESLGGNAVLIIDGLDALRSEMSQRAFRELIDQVARRVPQCAIVASIRTFDLQQSSELQYLFFESRMRPGTRQFRQVIVQPFSETDLGEVVKQIPGLEPLLESSSDEIRELLRNPFNLHLADQLLQRGTEAVELSGIQSQVQLLDKYWGLRVESPHDGYDRKVLLRNVVRQMIDRKALSVPEVCAYTPGLSTVFMKLQSDEILRRGITDRVLFTHNVLFDYAVARLVLDEEVIFDFIAHDTSRTIFFRPSLSFFFHRLWFGNRGSFWTVALTFFGSEQLPERARVVSAVAIYEAASTDVDLDRLIEDRSEAANRGIAGILQAVQAFGGLQSRKKRLWLTTLARLADRLSLDFVNEYVALLNMASEGTSVDGGSLIGTTARKLLRWMWSQAAVLKHQNALQLADIGAARVFPVLMKFYSSDPEASRQVVVDVMNRFGSSVSGSHEAFWLANAIKSIIQNDPELAVEVYRRTFRHQETSQEKTAIGGTVILPFTSTRQQDFSSARYGLQMGFQAFLEAAPTEAARAAIESVNAEVEREHPTVADPDKLEEFTFQYDGLKLKYRSDFSEIWDSGTRSYSSLTLLSATLKSAAERLSAERDRAVGASMLRAIAYAGSYAVAWKRLLEAAIANCGAFYPEVFLLLTVPEFISAPETTIATGNFLKAAYRHGLVNNSEAAAIEAAVWRIPEAPIIQRYEKPESIRNRLLMCIPPEQIRSADLKALSRAIVEADEMRENEPYHQVSVTTGPFSTEDWLREQGTDTGKPENVRILEALKPVEDFERRYVNETPGSEECAHIEPHLRRLNGLVAELTFDRSVAERVRGTLCAAAGSVLRNSALSANEPLVQLCRTVVLAGATDPSPEFNPKYHLPFDMPSWGSPSPRIEAAQGLSHFLWNWGLDAEVVNALELLSRDTVPAVRFQVASGLLGFCKHEATAAFWALAEEMISREQTTGVMLALVQTVGRVAGREPQRVITLLSSAIERGLPQSERSELRHSLLHIFTGLYIVQNNHEANEQLHRFEADPVKFHNEMTEEVLTAAYYLTPHNAKDNETRARSRELLARIVGMVYKALQSLAESPQTEERGQAFGDLLRVLDEVAFRAFIALDVDQQLRTGTPELDDSSRRELYFELKPIIELLTSRSGIPGQHYLAPRTAHNLMQAFNRVLSYDPASVLTYAAAVCRASSALSYQFDPMAITEMTKLVKRVLADHKEILRDATAANALGEMLDIFVKAGWPEAMHLTFGLDQAIR